MAFFTDSWTLASITTAILYVAYVALLGKLIATRLYKVYPSFTAYVAFQLIRTLAAALIPFRSAAYAYLYFVTQPIIWILYILVVFELFQRVLASHPGIASFSRKFVGWALGIAALISVGTLLLNLQSSDSRYVVLNDYLLLERVITSSILLFVILLTGFLAYFPVPLHRNARVYAAVFNFYFLSKTALLLSRNLLGPDVINQVNMAARYVAVGSLLIWTVMLTKAGEQVTVKSNWLSNPEDEKKLLAQLDAINATLMRSAKD